MPGGQLVRRWGDTGLDGASGLQRPRPGTGGCVPGEHMRPQSVRQHRPQCHPSHLGAPPVGHREVSRLLRDRAGPVSSEVPPAQQSGMLLARHLHPTCDLTRTPSPPHPALSRAQPEGSEPRSCAPVHPTPGSLFSQAGLTSMTQRHITALTRPQDGRALL